MARARRATLRSVYWKNFFATIRFCYQCGGRLKRQYVKAEKSRRHACVRCKQITYLNPKVVAGLIPVMPDGRVALLRRAIEPGYGKWSYPAGFQELGESTETAAVRETWEEICARARVTKLVGIYSYPDAGVVTIVYEGKILPKEIPSAGAETLDVKLFRKNKIPWKTLAFRSTVHALKDWRKRR